MAELDLEEVARTIGLSAYNAWTATLVGNPARTTADLNHRMRDVQLGDWVVETTTILMSSQRVGGRRPALDAVGKLLKITEEKVRYEDPDFVWDEAEEGRPHPTERCYYIRTLDNREFRWTNAMFVAVAAEWPMRGTER